MLLAGDEVAVLAPTADEMTLRYARDIAETSVGKPVISVSLLVRPEPYTAKEIAPFFDGLLPEGLTRERIATRLRLDPTDTFALLREIGRDCAGALSIVPSNEESAVERDDAHAGMSYRTQYRTGVVRGWRCRCQLSERTVRAWD